MLSEHQEQVIIFEWAKLHEGRYPELQWLFAVPNGGHRNKIVAAKLKREGVRAGISDIILLVPRRGFHGLCLELKRSSVRKATKKQIEFCEFVTDQKYLWKLCSGANEAIELLEWYLKS